MASSTAEKQHSKAITLLLNGTNASMKNIIPLQHNTGKAEMQGNTFSMEYGVLIGITGDVGGKLVLSGHSNTFRAIGKAMFGMPLEDDMLPSFSGELGNMIAGGLSTFISANEVHINITAPTLLQGNTVISGYKLAIKVTTAFEQAGDLSVYLMLD
ncbi:hypothetical protein JNUCC1_02902 [Lentibacillus sp. JNUCC-1]|uniref:chemotaxis protein CheX n=1 Tax=Lentibacillus sp. JNUCC-1 TaxID=2654513 RepID=UPI0012E94E2B|nr:chemotaxis protein CheX [Lentibacillus sp. JNUCC-1]MUV39030.1 hypothetical protein [Lentibacillus sp. JNUCC-1]